MRKPTVDVSIVVSTKNRAGQLADALSHYARIKSALSWEAVFVNNGSTDDTAEVLARFASSARVPVRVLFEPTPGVSAGRNAGWRAAAGSIIAFTDDDRYPAENYVDQVWACFRESDLGYVGGRILLYDKNDYPLTISPSTIREEIPPHSFLRAGVVHGANLAFRRDVLDEIGGFDERLGPGRTVYGEELILTAQASALGYAGAYDPRPVVYHHHRRSRSNTAEIRRLMSVYDMGRGAYYAYAVRDPLTRPMFLWPVLRRIMGNVRRGDFRVMAREFRGAWMYLNLDLSDMPLAGERTSRNRQNEQ